MEFAKSGYTTIINILRGFRENSLREKRRICCKNCWGKLVNKVRLRTTKG